MRDDADRLRDILVAIDRIQQETRVPKSIFAVDPKLQVWVIYHLQIIGEACRGLSPAFRAQTSNPIWSKAIGLRNILVHHYFEIDHDLIWQVIERDLPNLYDIVHTSLRALDPNHSS